MELFFIRHGQAADSGPDGGDFSRTLTAKGEKQARAAGQLLAHLDLVPDLVFSSPRARAVETAEGLMAAAAMDGQPVQQEWLNFDFRAQIVLDELAALPEEIGRVALVGHEPSFSGMVSWLLGAEVGYLEVKKASIVQVELSPPSRHGSVLKMLVPSKVLLGQESDSGT